MGFIGIIIYCKVNFCPIFIRKNKELNIKLFYSINNFILYYYIN
jgi:hypothetical protein